MWSADCEPAASGATGSPCRWSESRDEGPLSANGDEADRRAAVPGRAREAEDDAARRGREEVVVFRKAGPTGCLRSARAGGTESDRWVGAI